MTYDDLKPIQITEKILLKEPKIHFQLKEKQKLP